MSEFQIVEYNTTAAALAELRARHSGPFDVSTNKGMALAKEARAEIRGYRVALETLRKEIKAPALERCRLIDDEAKRITAELLKIEDPIDAVIKAEEKRKEEEKAAKLRQEAARVAAIAARISEIRNRVGTVANQPAATIRAALEQVNNLNWVPRDFEEFLPDALQALDETRAALTTLLLERLAHEEEQDRLQAEREAEQARLQAEREELERLRAAEAAHRAEQARIAEEARQAREAEDARLTAQRAEMERQSAELAVRQRALEEAERQRQAQATKTKARNQTKNPADPLAALKQALASGSIAAPESLDQAYQIGFADGLKSAQQSA